MVIRRYASDLLSSNMYLLEENGHVIVIDPFRDTQMLGGLLADKILLTHEHYDHISGVNLWKEATGAPVLCSGACAENIRNPRKNLARIFEAFCELQTWIVLEEIPQGDPEYTCAADETFADEFTFIWRGHTLRLFEMPGHSMGSIGILLDSSFFFSGDSLMKGREIELRFPGGSRAQWETVGLPRLQRLPPGIRVYPGHFEDFTYPGGGEADK